MYMAPVEDKLAKMHLKLYLNTLLGIKGSYLLSDQNTAFSKRGLYA